MFNALILAAEMERYGPMASIMSHYLVLMQRSHEAKLTLRKLATCVPDGSYYMTSLLRILLHNYFI